jgi:hypothetical protein
MFPNRITICPDTHKKKKKTKLPRSLVRTQLHAVQTGKSFEYLSKLCSDTAFDYSNMKDLWESLEVLSGHGFWLSGQTWLLETFIFIVKEHSQ